MTFPVPRLSVPDAQTGITVTVLKQYESARLFMDRAKAVQRNFHLTERNAMAVADICDRLDGIPLAIELAAARVSALSAEQIAARLNDRFRLLSRGDKTALPRQQTLRALIDWSYDLLIENERTLLRRLAVFVGGWTLEAAEVVGSDESVARAAVLDLLTNLVEKSLVTSEADGGRYRLLETVRQYAQERLDETGERDRVRERHLHYYLEFAEKARPELLGPEQGAWLARLDAERENLLAAHRWCSHLKDGGELGLRLVYSMKPYWINRGQLGLGLRATIESLTHSAAKERTIARCRALLIAGQLGCGLGAFKGAQGYLEESLAIAREIGDKGRIAAVLQPLGQASLGQGDLVAARTHLEEALALARQLGNQREIAAAMNALAQLHRAKGDLDAAEPLYENVLVLARELGDRESVAIGLLNLAMVSIGRGSTEPVPAMVLEVIAISNEIGSMPAGQSVLDVCAGLATMRAQWERSALFFGAAEEQARKMGLHRDSADQSFLMPRIYKARDALGETKFAAREVAGRALSYEDAMVKARDWLQGQH
jgi:predicted ATPase